MLVIGLTGGIGTGKSEVSRILASLGATVIDADELGHQAYRRGTRAWKRIVEAFGHQVVDPKGEIDRKRLGEVVFGDPKAKVQLEVIVHPGIRRKAQAKLRELRKGEARVAVLEAAVLVEAGWTSLVDEVWMTAASPENVLERIQKRNRLSTDQVKARIGAQMPQEQRAGYAQAIIKNDGDLEQLEEKVKDLWQSRISRRS